MSERTYTADEKLAARKHLALAAECEWMLQLATRERRPSFVDRAVVRNDIREARHRALKVLGPEAYRRAGGPEL